MQFRADAFDLFNHPNYRTAERHVLAYVATTFGIITCTRFPTGDSGSSRQLQLAMKLSSSFIVTIKT